MCENLIADFLRHIQHDADGEHAAAAFEFRAASVLFGHILDAPNTLPMAGRLLGGGKGRLIGKISLLGACLMTCGEFISGKEPPEK